MDVFSFVDNQASLAQIKNPAMGIYGERRFLLTETSMYEGVLAIPSGLGNWGIDLKYSGFKNFNESQIGLAYARSLGSKIDIGLQFNYYSYHIPSYVSDKTVTAEVGAIIHLTEDLNAGIHVYNPVGGKFVRSNEKLLSSYAMGFGYDVSEKVFISTEIVKQEDAPVNINAAVQYNFMKQLFARAGISSGTSSYFAGFGLGWSNFRLDISGSYHPQLGLSPGLLFIMNLDKKSKE
jgi:hypothetical protein